MATVNEIVTRVQRRLIDLPAAVSAESQKLVEEAHREIQDHHNFKTMEALLSLTTTADSPDLGLITNVRFKEYRGDPFWTDEFGQTHYLKITHDEGEVRRAFNQAADFGSGRPRVLLHRRPEGVGDPIQSNVLRVFPVPDGLAPTSTGEYTIRIPYWSYVAFPATSSWFTDNAEQWLVCRATAEGFALNWDEAKHMFWMQRAQQELRRAISKDKRLMISGVDTIVPHAGANAAKVRL